MGVFKKETSLNKLKNQFERKIRYPVVKRGSCLFMMSQEGAKQVSLRYLLPVSPSEVARSCPNSLQLHGLYSPWNSPGQNTGGGSLSLLQGIFLIQGSNPGLPHCRQIPYQLSRQGSPRILQWVPITSSADLSNPGIELDSSALQVDSLPTELSGNPKVSLNTLKYLQSNL